VGSGGRTKNRDAHTAVVKVRGKMDGKFQGKPGLSWARNERTRLQGGEGVGDENVTVFDALERGESYDGLGGKTKGGSILFRTLGKERRNMKTGRRLLLTGGGAGGGAGMSQKGLKKREKTCRVI